MLILVRQSEDLDAKLTTGVMVFTIKDSIYPIRGLLSRMPSFATLRLYAARGIVCSLSVPLLDSRIPELSADGGIQKFLLQNELVCSEPPVCSATERFVGIPLKRDARMKHRTEERRGYFVRHYGEPLDPYE